jgi:hypothetical protein
MSKSERAERGKLRPGRTAIRQSRPEKAVTERLTLERAETWWMPDRG